MKCCLGEKWKNTFEHEEREEKQNRIKSLLKTKPELEESQKKKVDQCRKEQKIKLNSNGKK